MEDAGQYIHGRRAEPLPRTGQKGPGAGVAVECECAEGFVSPWSETGSRRQKKDRIWTWRYKNITSELQEDVPAPCPDIITISMAGPTCSPLCFNQHPWCAHAGRDLGPTLQGLAAVTRVRDHWALSLAAQTC